MSELKEITLRKRGITIVPEKKTIQMMEAKTLLDEFYGTRNALGILRYIF